MTDLAPRLVGFIQSEVCAPGIDLTVETDLLLTGAVDSLGVIRITQWIEDETNVSVDPGDVTLENFQTIDRMLAYIATRQGPAPAGEAETGSTPEHDYPRSTSGSAPN